MLAILSPAKTLDFNKSCTSSIYTEPVLLDKAFELMEELKKFSPWELSSLMNISDELAEINFYRHSSWVKEHTLENSKQCLIAYSGAVFQGLGAESFNEDALLYAQEHIRILSGLYGVLSPLDIVQPYRLEMVTKLKNPLGNNLYSFWKNIITDYFIEKLSKDKEGTLLNLASKEYSSVIDLKKLNSTIITPAFKEYKGGVYKNVTIYAKRARGLMARYMVENKIDKALDLKSFNEEDYEFNEKLSTENEWVFVR